MRTNSTAKIIKHAFLLDDLIQPLLTLFSCQAQQKGVILVSHTHPSVPKNIYHDAEKVRQILSNLLSNAIRFTDSGIIKLHITLEAQNNISTALCFRILDSGTGIPHAALQNIFEPYQQAGNAQKCIEGTGLGLSISRQLARAMNGDIHAHSVEGRGSVFTLILPWQDALSEAPIKTLRTLQLLVIDDSDIHRTTAHVLLENLGHTVVATSCAHSAITALQTQHIDAIFLDVHLPAITSTQMIEKIIAATKNSNATPYIIAVSAWLDSDDMTQLLACGVKAVCTKPLDRWDLQQMLAALCAETSPLPQHRIS